MRVWLRILSVLLTLSSIHRLAADEHGIVLTLSPSECQAGDVIELHARMTRSDYAEFELKLPKIEALHFVAYQQSPITYSKGFYSQSAVWVFQPTRSGDIEWDSIRALIKQGEQSREFKLPALRLSVLPYTDTEDLTTPELLPEEPKNSSSERSFLWRFIWIGIGCLTILCFTLKRKAQS